MSVASYSLSSSFPTRYFWSPIDRNHQASLSSRREHGPAAKFHALIFIHNANEIERKKNRFLFLSFFLKNSIRIHLGHTIICFHWCIDQNLHFVDTRPVPVEVYVDSVFDVNQHEMRHLNQVRLGHLISIKTNGNYFEVKKIYFLSDFCFWNQTCSVTWRDLKQRQVVFSSYHFDLFRWTIVNRED